MNKLTLSLLAAGLMVSGAAFAQSAKFTAVYSDENDGSFVLSQACDSTDESYCGATGAEDANSALAGFATIRVPQAKELLVGLSAQVALGTYTEAKGKRGSYSVATAFAEGGVTLYACVDGDTDTCYEGKPGYVTLANRNQELEAVLGGVIESCEVDVVLDLDTETASGSFTLADCNVLDEMIALGITTLTANHFNFVFPNLPQGDYEIIAKFATEAAATADAYCYYTDPDSPGYDPEVDPTALDCSEEDGSATGEAWAYIGKWMMTVQTVRAVKREGESGDVIDIE